MLRLRHDSFGLDLSTTLRRQVVRFRPVVSPILGAPIPILAIANKTPTKIINIYPKWMKYETTDVVPMQRPTATYTWAVVGGELADPRKIADHFSL